MNFLNLQYFLAAAEELNFTQAANRLYISQQSLSNHISKLEKELGLPLFDRQPPMTLTPAGLILLKNARNMLSLKQKTENEIKDLNDFYNSEITIGISRERGAVMLPVLLTKFHKAFPHVRLHLVEGTSQVIEEALYKGKVDFTISFTLNDPVNISSEVLRKERTMIIVPNCIMKEYFPDTEKILCSENGYYSLALFRDCPFITVSTSTWLGAIFDNCCKELGLTPHIILETDMVRTMISLCIEGMGVIICPDFFVNSFSSDTLSKVSIFPLDYKPATHSIGINRLKNKYLTLASREFIKLTKQLMQS